MPIGSQLIGRLSAVYQIVLGTGSLAICMLTSSMLKPEPAHFLPFALIYGSGWGLVNGITYMVAVKNSWATMPQKPALIAGVVISGFGLGSLIYTKLANLIVNP